MKKTITIIIVIALIVSFSVYLIGLNQGLSYDPSTTYTIPAMITEIDRQTCWVTLVDWNGEAWCIRDDAFVEGELVIVTFNDNDTETIYDDLIIEVCRANLVPTKDVE